MEQFAEIFNKLQSVIQVVGQDISFPQIVVVGSQSDGKSSVLESIVKNGFLPRGTGLVTRTPIILQLKNSPSAREEFAEVSYDGGKEGRVVKQLNDFGDVAYEIQSATAKLAGTSQNIVNRPITVTMRSANVPDLTLVDLPGLVENPAGDQPKDIKDQVERLIREYIENPNAIILAVHQATTDLANSKSLNLARQVDPDGHRTVCVVTKLDLVEPGTDMTSLLNGHDIALHHSKVLKVIGVINRSQINAENPRWSSTDQEALEDKYFRNYKKIAFEHGSRVLSEYLSLKFREHIRKCMPALKAGVDELVSYNQSQLELLGKDIQEEENAERDLSLPDPQHVLLVNIITDFCLYLNGSLDGNVDQGSSEIRGGAKLEELFNSTYWSAIGAIVPLDQVSEVETWTQIRNSWGAERQMFLSIKAFGFLVRTEMDRMCAESLRCVGLAHQEMLTIRDNAGLHIANIREQFPNLFERINDIVASFLEQKLKETKDMVEHCVKMQLDYVNVKHPDFLTAQQHAAKRFGEIAALLDSPNKDATDGSTNINGSLRVAPVGNTKASPAPAARGPSRFKADLSDSEEENKKKDEKSNKPIKIFSNQRPLTNREKLECEITMDLVRRYFDVIRSIVRDSVPKVIMRFMVNEIKSKVQAELLTKLATRETYGPLLMESEIMATKRKHLKEKIKMYQEAAKLVRELGVS